jgi:2-dehydro-3-deoxyphosphogluconate aldolase/(4S)-4-hydroxy-2-oxoglutarate aldolase
VQITDIINASPVMPIVLAPEVSQAVPLARALLAGGISVMEVRLRSADALDAVQEIRRLVPDMTVGVGMITSAKDLQAAVDAGAQFGTSPGSSIWLLDAAQEFRLPFLPGAMTPSDVLSARDAGFRAFKFFPARAAGGPTMLKALGSVFPDVQFYPSGGITAANAREYLALPNVACVGGSWVTPKLLVEARDWAAIEQLAQDATTLRDGLKKPVAELAGVR